MLTYISNHQPLQPRPLLRGFRQEVAVDWHRRHQGPLRESRGRHTAVPCGFGAVSAQGRGGAPHSRQRAGTGLPRGLRQVPIVSERVGASTLPPSPLQDAGLRRQCGLFRQRQPYGRGYRDERGQHPQFRGGHPHRRAGASASGNATIRRGVDGPALREMPKTEILRGSGGLTPIPNNHGCIRHEFREKIIFHSSLPLPCQSAPSPHASSWEIAPRRFHARLTVPG